MKILQSSVFRALCSMVVGGLLVAYPDSTVEWITVAIGVLFLLSGVISLISWFSSRRVAGEYVVTDASGRVVGGGRRGFPIVALGSIILGTLLAVRPDIFVKWLMYVIGSAMVVGAISQFVALVQARKYGSFSLVFWICPSLVLLAGLFAMVKPMETAGMPLLILGWCCLVYGVSEIVNTVKITSQRRRMERQQNSGGDGI